LVISLDFELHWGVRDQRSAHGPYRANLLGAREAVLRTLDLFAEFGVAATWAAVGFLFARSRDELERFAPTVRPAYQDPALNPYDEALGTGEADDPLHFAPSLIDAIRRADRQELATHTFSHYYCLEPGQTREAFEADIRSAVAIAEQYGVRPRTIIFPRNQHNPAYTEVLREAGITCYRGNPPGRIYRPTDTAGDIRWIRAARLADAYLDLSGAATVRWDRVVEPGGMCNVPASRFLRPYSPRLRSLEPMRLRRLVGALRQAARAQEIFHLWWHPHNFGIYMEENLSTLRKFLVSFDEHRRSHGMRSLTMDEVAVQARAGGVPE
jgi:peptidoglycan/xylan/chitin deacetylase (PgdA/CDA1 family)